MSNYTKTTDFEAKDSLPTGDSGKIIRGSEFETEFDAISTAIATKADTAGPTFTGTLTFETISDGTIGVTAFVDEDDMSSDSATLVPTQQSVKAYVDSQVTAQDLDFQADTGGALSIDLDSETMTFTGGTGIDTSGSGNAVTFAIDSTVATLTGSQTLTNKTLTSPVLNTGVSGTAVLDEDDMSSNSATQLATQQSIKAYVDSQVGANNELSEILANGNTTGGTNIVFGDSASVSDDRLVFGTGSDLQIYHSGTHSYIDDAGTGNLTLRGNASVRVEKYEGEILADFAADGAVSLYHDNSVKIATTSTGVSVTGNVAVSGTVDGRDVATDGTKLDGIEAGATGDQTNAEIRAAVEAATDSNVFTDADHSKLDGIEASADVTDTANVTAAGALMDSELTSEASVKALNQGVATTDSPTFAGVTVNGNVEFDGLSGTGSVNVTDILDQDDMSSNSATALATQQSIKAYVDSQVATVDTLAEVLGNGNTTGGTDIAVGTGDDITFADNSKAIFGAGSDLQIYHDGFNSYIDDAGTGGLIVRADNFYLRKANDVENMIIGSADGAVTLYHDNSAKLATTSTGIDVTGVITTDGMTTSADINFGDNDKAVFGAGSDLQIFHDGSNSYIENTAPFMLIESGTIVLRNTAGTEDYAKFNENSDVKLYFDNAQKFATTSTGINVTGLVESDEALIAAGTGTDAIQTLRMGSGGGGTNKASINFQNSAASEIFSIDFNNSTGTFDINGDLGGTALSIARAGAATFNNTITIPSQIIHSGDTDTYLEFSAANTWRVVAGNEERFKIASGEVTVNESSQDTDFRVESNNNTHALFVDAGNDRIGLFEDAPTAPLHLTTTSAGTAFLIESSDAGSNGGPIITLDRSSSSPANSDTLGMINFNGRNDAGEHHNYARIESRIVDVANATEDGRLELSTSVGTTEGTSRLLLNGTETVVNDNSANLDFRVESNANSTFLFVDAGNERLHINGTTGTATFNVAGSSSFANTATSGALVASGATLSIQGTGTYNSNYFGTDRATVAIRSNEPSNDGWNPTLNIATIRQSLGTNQNATGGIGFTTIDDSNNTGIDDAARIQVINTNGANNTSATGLVFYNNVGGSKTQASRAVFKLAPYEAVFNEDSLDIDFRVESDSQTHMLFVDASANKIGINQSNPAAMLDILTVSTAGADAIRLRQPSSSDTFQIQCGISAVTNDGLFLRNTNSTGQLQGWKNFEINFNDDSVDRDFRVESDNDTHCLFVDAGNDQILIGNTASTQGEDYLRLDARPGTSGHVIISGRDDTSTKNHHVFVNPNGSVGSIQTAGSATLFNTSSDARLKENIADAQDAGALIDAIQVRQFDWIEDGEHQRYGMVAQELNTVAPEAVSEGETEEDMMGVDYSKLVPMLVKEIQSLRARVAQLESN